MFAGPLWRSPGGRRGLRLQRGTRGGRQAAEGGRIERTGDLRGRNEGEGLGMVAVDASLEETCVSACGGTMGTRKKRGFPGCNDL